MPNVWLPVKRKCSKECLYETLLLTSLQLRYEQHCSNIYNAVRKAIVPKPSVRTLVTLCVHICDRKNDCRRRYNN